MIATEMESNETEVKTSNANVSSNNSLESEDITDEIKTPDDSNFKTEELESKMKNAQLVEDPRSNVLNESNGSAESNLQIMAEVEADAFDGNDLSNPLAYPPKQGETEIVYNGNEELYLPRSALITTPKGLSARDYVIQTNGIYNTYQQQNETGVAHNVRMPNYECGGANIYGNEYQNAFVYQADNRMVTNDASANKLYYDSSGLAYSYDGYQFYAAGHMQANFPEQQKNQAHQTSCILTQYGETTYVNYVPTDYLPQYFDLAQGRMQPQGQQFIPPVLIPATYGQTVVQEAPVQDLQVTLSDDKWSTNDDVEPLDLEKKEELVGVYESESGEIILIESQENEKGGEGSHICKTWNGFKAPEIENGVPITDDASTKIDDVRTDNPQSDCPFPSLFVSHNGLITVLLRDDISLEMTPIRDLRLVNHVKKIVVATNSRGNSSVLIHPAVKLSQSGTTTDLELFLARKAKMTTESITFGNNFGSYKFDFKKIIEEPYPVFKDLSKDESVNFLDSEDAKRKEELVSLCCQKSSQAHFDYFSNGGFKVFINGVKVIQNSKGDVSVTNGPKFLRMSPSSSRLCVQTHFIEASVEANWNVKIRRGTHTLNASHLGFVVSNGQIEASFDDRNRLRVFKLPERVPLRLGQSRQRRPGVQRRRYPYKDNESKSVETYEYTSRYYR